MNAPVKSDAWKLDPTKAALAARNLRTSLVEAFGEGADEELILDSIEGETGFYEAIDDLVSYRELTIKLAEGVDRHLLNLSARKERFEKRAEMLKALIEQAMLTAEVPKLERPTGTLSMVTRAPTLIVIDESEIPSTYFETGDPKLNKRALAAALKARLSALDGLPPADDPAYAEALASVPPEITGATLSNGVQSLTIRVK